MTCEPSPLVENMRYKEAEASLFYSPVWFGRGESAFSNKQGHDNGALPIPGSKLRQLFQFFYSFLNIAAPGLCSRI
jgi:hypothetical protein